MENNVMKRAACGALSAALALALGGLPAGCVSGDAAVRVAACDLHGLDSWESRRDGLAELVDELDLDLLALRGVTAEQCADLRARLPGWAVSEGAGICYRRGLFAELARGELPAGAGGKGEWKRLRNMRTDGLLVFGCVLEGAASADGTDATALGAALREVADKDPAVWFDGADGTVNVSELCVRCAPRPGDVELLRKWDETLPGLRPLAFGVVGFIRPAGDDGAEVFWQERRSDQMMRDASPYGPPVFMQ